MTCFKEENAGDADVSARLFDAETGYFDPTVCGSVQISPIVVEISSWTSSLISRFRLNRKNLSSCAVRFPIESSP